MSVRGVMYSDVLNLNELDNKFDRMLDDDVESVLGLDCHLTEKIDGENFRVGIDDEGNAYIGQRRRAFKRFEGEKYPDGYIDNFPEHPNWNKFSDKLLNDIDVILKHFRSKGYKNIVAYGELCGNGLQGRFKFPFDGYQVYWYDVFHLYKYESPDMYEGNWLSPEASQEFFGNLGLDIVPSLGFSTLRQAIKMDVESLESKVAENDFIEGVVATPVDPAPKKIWRFPGRLIVKVKTARFAEQDKSRRKKKNDGPRFVSKFAEFVTVARIEHAIQYLKEDGIKIEYMPKDLQYIPKRVIEDIQKECNEGEPLSQEDRKFLGRYVPQIYHQFLRDRLEGKYE